MTDQRRKRIPTYRLHKASGRAVVTLPASGEVDLDRDGSNTVTDLNLWDDCYADPEKYGYVDELFPHTPLPLEP